MNEQVSWQEELDNLVSSAKTDEEKAAMVAFAKAIGPYLDKPDMLRTLIGKIAAPIEEIAVLVSDKEFASMQELEDALPEGVRIASTL